MINMIIDPETNTVTIVKSDGKGNVTARTAHEFDYIGLIQDDRLLNVSGPARRRVNMRAVKKAPLKEPARKA